MSTTVMSACWMLQMPPKAKAVLISLADNANDAGHCWPSIDTIAARTCLSRDSVMRAIRELEALGHITADRSNGRHTTYMVHPETGLFDTQNQSQGATGRRVQPVANQQNQSQGATAFQQNQSQIGPKPVAGCDSNQKQPRARSKTKATVKSEGRARVPRFTPPTEVEVADYCRERGRGVDPERWFAHYTSNGWRVGKNPMRDWRAAVRTWERNDLNRDNPHANRPPSHNRSAVERVEDAIRRKRAEHPELYEAEASGIDAGPPVGADGGPLRPCLDVEVRRLTDRAGCR